MTGAADTLVGERAPAGTLATSGKVDVPVWRQLGPNDVRRVGVPCFVGVQIDVAQLISKLGEKALKSKGKRATAFYGALVVSVREVPTPAAEADRATGEVG